MLISILAILANCISKRPNLLLITGQTENTKRTDQTQDFDDYGKQELDAREKQDIDDFEKPIINQHYTGLSRAMHSRYNLWLYF